MNVAWQGLILGLAFPERWRSNPLWADPTVAVYMLDLPAGTNADPLDANDNARAVEALFRLLGEFLELRERSEGLTMIFLAYVAWLSNEQAEFSE